jgi:hypothetical protein
MLALVLAPSREFLSDLLHAPGSLEIQALVPEPAVEAIDIAVLCGFP